MSDRPAWVDRLVRNVDAWVAAGMADGLRDLVDVLPDPDDPGEDGVLEDDAP